MPDIRFYEPLGPMSVGELAVVAGAQIPPGKSPDRQILGAAPLHSAMAGEVAFFSDRRYAEALGATAAGACFVAADDATRLPDRCIPLVAANPHEAFVRAVTALHRPRRLGGGEVIDPSAQIEPGAIICAGAAIGAGAQIGSGTWIGANAIIGPGVCIGRDCEIGSGAAISFSLIGDRVKIYSGAVVGEAGFGVAGGARGLVDVPQLGRVIIQDDVTIGAATCVDRGAFDDTAIGANTKIDNMCQIAHNVVIGRNCVFAAQTGISGSVVIGDGVQCGGKVGISDHLRIGAGARLAAGALTMRDVPAGETWGGTPARPLRRFMKEVAWLARQVEARAGGANGRD